MGLEAALSELLSGSVPPGMTHELSVEGGVEEAAAEVREELFLVLREAVRNAVAHSGASKLRVEVGTDRGGPTWPNAPRWWAAPVRSSRPLAKERGWRRASRLTALSAPNADFRDARAGEPRVETV